MLKFVNSIMAGTAIGAALGFAIPVAMWLFELATHSWIDSGSGVPTLFAPMLVVTIPACAGLGVLFGAIVGALRS